MNSVNKMVMVCAAAVAVTASILPLSVGAGPQYNVSPVNPRVLTCVPASAPGRVALVYARAVDGVDHYAARAPKIREAVNAANGYLQTDSEARGVVASIPVECNGGVPVVGNVVLATAAATASYHTMVADLGAAGWNHSDAKYWVLYDGTVSGGASGSSVVLDDDRLIAGNLNNVGPSYSITYNAALATGPWLHEGLHAMGAVQNTAPHTSGAHHCNDGRDVVCRADGGPSSNYSQTACTDREYVDCNHDDYFDTSPSPTGYLATHWNVGSSVNKFLHFVNASDLPTSPLTVSVAVTPTDQNGIQVSWRAPQNHGASTVVGYNVYRAQRDPSDGVNGKAAPLPHLVALGNVLGFRDHIQASGVYQYMVAAVNAGGEGAFSEAPTVTATCVGLGCA